MDNEEEKQDQPNPSQGPVPPTGGGGGAVRLAPSSSVAPAAGGGRSGGTTPNAAGGQFASLNQYVNANQAQAVPLANKLSEGIGKEYSNLDAQNNATIAGINSQVQNAPGYTPSNPDVLAQEAANPVSFAGDQGNVKNFQSLLTNTYGGPLTAESTSGFANQQAAINNAIAAGQQQTTTEAGRKQLLEQNEATPTGGVTSLNSAILSQSPEALGQVETAYKPFSNLLTNLSSGAQGVNQTISKEKADAASSAKAANDAIAAQISKLNAGVGSALTTAQQNAATQAATLKSDLAAGKLSDADLKSMGLTADQWNSLSAAQKAAATSQAVTSANGQFGANTGTTNVDLTNFLTSQDPNLAFTAANVATPEQYKEAQAFQTLLNGLNLGAPSTVISPTTASQAGTAPTNINSFDYQTALNTAQSAQSEELAAANAYVAALQAGADEEHAQAQAANAAKNAARAGMAAVASTPVAATEGAAAGLVGAGQNLVNQGKTIISNPTNAAKNLAANVATGGLYSTGQAIAGGVQKAVNTVTQIFCFHPDTLVTMLDGTSRPIHKIQVGDEVKGGAVLATTRAVGRDFYWYKGVLVTGKHAVNENGRWIRVADSKLGHAIPKYVEIVHSLVTVGHRIWVGDIEFADQNESDNYENLNLDQSLAELNEDAESLG